MDGLRALAIAGVVLGHWMVSAVAIRADGHLANESPLRYLPGLIPLSWLLQPLAVFFLVGGWSAARQHAYARAGTRGHVRRLGRRWRPLLPPVGAFVVTWLLVWAGMFLAGVPSGTIHTLVRLAFSPLWFLLVLIVLTAFTPLVRRFPTAAAGTGFLVVTVTDVVRMLAPNAGWVQSVRCVNVIAGWLVPYAIGALWAAGRLGRRPALALLVAGASATAALIHWGGYPASMVGVPGDGMSNLDPPSLAAVCFGLAQCGLAVLSAGALRRLLAGTRGIAPYLWALVAMTNVLAIGIFLWHQSAMLLTTVITLDLGWHTSGLHAVPQSAWWVIERLAWLPVLASALCGFLLLFGGAGRALPFRGRGDAPPHRTRSRQGSPSPSASDTGGK